MNKMCKDCKKYLAGTCKGASDEIWTGCALKVDDKQYEKDIYITRLNARRLLEINDKAEQVYAENPEDEKLEADFNKTYTDFWNENKKLIVLIQEYLITDFNTAKKIAAGLLA